MRVKIAASAPASAPRRAACGPHCHSASPAAAASATISARRPAPPPVRAGGSTGAASPAAIRRCNAAHERSAAPAGG